MEPFHMREIKDELGKGQPIGKYGVVSLTNPNLV